MPEEQKETIRQIVTGNYSRRAEDSDADRWSTAYIEQCRRGEREPMFTPPPPDTPSGGGLFSGLRDLFTFQ